MSKLANLLRKPRVSRLISFAVVAVLIGVSAYFVYKRGVSASVDTACTIKIKDGVNIQYDSIQTTDETGGAVVNGWPNLYAVLNNSTVNNQETMFISNANRYINIYGEGGDIYLYSKGSNKLSTVPQSQQPVIKSNGFDCRGGKVWEVTEANTSRTGTQKINVAQVSGTTQDQICVQEIASGQYLKVSRQSIANTEGTIYNVVDQGFCEQGPGGDQATNGTVTTHCIESYDIAARYKATYTLSNNIYTRVAAAISGNAPSTLDKNEVSSGNFGLSNSACQASDNSQNPGGSATGQTGGTPQGDTQGNLSCSTGSIKVTETMTGNMVCAPCDSVRGAGDLYTVVNQSEMATRCPANSDAGANSSFVNTSGVQWKCLTVPPSVTSWYFKNTSGQWQNKNNSGDKVSNTSRYEENSSLCGTVPTTTPSGASTTGGVADEAGANGIWKCNQFDAAGQEFDWVYKSTDGKYHTHNRSIVSPTRLVADTKCSQTPRPSDIPADAEPAANNLDRTLANTPGSIGVPVVGGNDANLKYGTVKITAYRYSQSGQELANGKYAEVGGVSFNLSGDVIVNQNSNLQLPQSSTAEKVFNDGFTCSAWQRAKAGLLSSVRNALFKNTVSFKVITPDNGNNDSTSQILKLPVGVYSISGGTKTGLRLKDSFCFSVAEGQTKDLKVLLVASYGAEPPSIQSDKVSYEKTPKGVNRYFANGFMYIPESPYYGWQKIDEAAGSENNYGYNPKPPLGYDDQGGIVPGIDPGLGMPGGSIQDLIRICQTANIRLNGSLDTGNLWQVGLGIGLLTGKGDIGDRLGDGLKGAGIGYLAGQLFGGKDLDFSINLNTINEQCQALNQVTIPFDCTGCYSGGVCPPGCMANNAGLQSLNLYSQLLGNR